MSRLCISSLWTLAVCFLCGPSPSLAQVKPKFQSKLVTSKTPGHAVEVDVDIQGARRLFLVVNDGGNGYGCDWADWAEPRLVGPKGELKLTELKWKSATTSWGKVNVNRNAGGGRLKINGKDVAYGIGTHANSVIAFDLPSGYARFKARGGLDNGGTDQGGGGSTSVKFLVFLEKPPARFVKASSGSGGGSGLEPIDSLEKLQVAEGLEATLFAAEPMLLSPSNIDVDAAGRVWVCEVVNYRHRNNSRPEGDRILILEDTDGDGKADKKSVFYQGRDIDSAHGVCVLGTPGGKVTRVIVSVAAGVYIFTDEDGDLKSDKKETFFTGISGTQHDHGIHAFIFGPDGRLYFNFGNSGRQIKNAQGKPIIDLAGNTVVANRQPYQEGMAFRCNMDGGAFETLGWNFRNNWELTVDSFGTVWQSDNDDDGNRGVRINYVMEFGNYGYKDEFTGAGWKSPRVGMHAEVPQRHWRLNDPGVVPNLLQTGAGSPTGICVYEGKLLPKEFHGQVIHCDAGPNIVRAYPVENDGAGYKAKIVNIIDGAADKWFRPSDVCVAPDGSLIVADWYDPGVGGHGMGDIQKGRIFRVAPPKTPYKIPQFDYSTPEAAVKALGNPNLAVRYLAFTALNKIEHQAENVLASVFHESKDQRLRARALWLLSQIKACGREYVEEALNDANADIRITALRAARRVGFDIIPYMWQLRRDRSPQVRRECLIALRHSKSPQAAELWAWFAGQHDGKDRWYLEALGIAADKQWDKFLDAWLTLVGGENDKGKAYRDIVWRSRATKTPMLLAAILRDTSLKMEDTPRYLRAFDFLPDGASKNEALVELAFSNSLGSPERASLINREALARLKGFNIKTSRYTAALKSVLDRSAGTPQFIQLVDKFNVSDRYPQVLALAQKNADQQLGVEAIRMLLSKNQLPLIRAGLDHKEATVAAATARALANSADGRIGGILRPIMDDAKRPLELRRQAARAVAKTRNGAAEILRLARADKLDKDLKSAAAFELHAAPWKEVRAEAAKLFPVPAAKDDKPLPPISQLINMKGDAARGLKVFATTGTCAKCHKVNGQGKEVGPDLSVIGGKLSRQAFFESILYPSAGISHNYETYVIATVDGNSLAGVITSQTPQSVTVTSSDGITRTFKRADIDEMEKSKLSLMPADLQKVMSAQDLVDVVEYMQTLKEKKGSQR